MRRLIAFAGAVCIALPLGLSGAAAPVPLTQKLSPAMQRLVSQGGYKDSLVPKLVKGFVKGSVYSLAKVSGRIDARLARDLKGAGARMRAAFPEIGYVALVSPLRSIASISRLERVSAIEVDGVSRVLDLKASYASAKQGPAWADQAKRGTHDTLADLLWAGGVTGEGVTIGVADSGVDSTHPDLDDLDWLRWGGEGNGAKLTGFVDCQASLPSLEDVITVAGQSFGASPPEICLKTRGYDDNGHGSHVAGIASGSAQGGTAGQQGMFPGMAPNAMIAGAKVCAAAGVCLNSNILAGIRWLALEKAEGGAGADVINMSLGGSRTYGAPVLNAELETNADPTAQLVNALAEIHNVLFVIAAGNSGPVLGSVSNPAAASQSLAVGASITDFELDHPTSQTLGGEFGMIRPEAVKAGALGIAGFSSRGPSGDRLVKPDVIAPGVYIVSAQSILGAQVGAGDVGHKNHFAADLRYAVLSGTSMAAPSAAGAAALVIDGYRKSIGSSPAYYLVKAALANTAGGHAFEGSVAGLLGGILVRMGAAELEDRYPTRNDGFVGVTGTGAGRIETASALMAITRGVVAYTPQNGTLDDIHELQPSWAMDDIAPGGSAQTTFVVRGAPQMARDARITWKASSAVEPPGVHSAPASWFSVPVSTTASRAREVGATFGLRVPAGAAPGIYASTIVGTADLGGGVKQRIRIPVQFFVRLVESNPEKGGVSLEGPIWASDVTDYSLVGFEDPLGDIHTDWTMIPLRVTEGTKRVDFTLYDPKGKDKLDLFVFNNSGTEMDSTVTCYSDHVTPAGVLFFPTSKDTPATLSIDPANPDGCFLGADPVQLPATIWLAISDSGPANPGEFATYHLDVDVAGGSVEPAAPPAPGPRPAPGSDRPLPATGVDAPLAAPVSLLAGAGMMAWGLLPRRRRV